VEWLLYWCRYSNKKKIGVGELIDGKSECKQILNVLIDMVLSYLCLNVAYIVRYKGIGTV